MKTGNQNPRTSGRGVVKKTQVHDSLKKLRKHGHVRPDGDVEHTGARGTAAKYYVLTEKPAVDTDDVAELVVVHVIKPAGTWERRRQAALLRPASPFDGLGN